MLPLVRIAHKAKSKKAGREQLFRRLDRERDDVVIDAGLDPDHPAVYELTGMPSHHSLQSYYRGTDRLYECKEALEEHLYAREKALSCMILRTDLAHVHHPWPD